MSDILDNAIDSLRMGLAHYLDEGLSTRDKWAILELFHTIELLLKERLQREHPILIYRSTDKPIGDDAQTVGLQEILARFTNLDIEIPVEHVAILKDLQRRRNRIEHHRFVEDPLHKRVIGEALKFIGYFMEEHLDEDLEDQLSPELFREAKELMISYDKLMARAMAEIDAIRSRLDPKERSMLDVGRCPMCGNRTVLIGVHENRCTFCAEAVEGLQMCQYCGEYMSEDDLAGSGICHGCFADRLADE